MAALYEMPRRPQPEELQPNFPLGILLHAGMLALVIGFWAPLIWAVGHWIVTPLMR